LYQNTDKQFLILHSLEGYDEVSLTCPFKYFFNEGEKIATPKDLGLPQLKYEQIKGGQTVEESAKIFMTILEGKGTDAQNAVVTANAAMALYAGERSKGLSNCVALAKETLASGRALQAFKKLIR
jgi:anthranilate phosphoribosyltransferase